MHEVHDRVSLCSWSICRYFFQEVPQRLVKMTGNWYLDQEVPRGLTGSVGSTRSSVDYELAGADFVVHWGTIGN